METDGGQLHEKAETDRPRKREREWEGIEKSLTER